MDGVLLHVAHPPYKILCVRLYLPILESHPGRAGVSRKSHGPCRRGCWGMFSTHVYVRFIEIVKFEHVSTVPSPGGPNVSWSLLEHNMAPWASKAGRRHGFLSVGGRIFGSMAGIYLPIPIGRYVPTPNNQNRCIKNRKTPGLGHIGEDAGIEPLHSRIWKDVPSWLFHSGDASPRPPASDAHGARLPARGVATDFWVGGGVESSAGWPTYPKIPPKSKKNTGSWPLHSRIWGGGGRTSRVSKVRESGPPTPRRRRPCSLPSPFRRPWWRLPSTSRYFLPFYFPFSSRLYDMTSVEWLYVTRYLNYSW